MIIFNKKILNRTGKAVIVGVFLIFFGYGHIYTVNAQSANSVSIDASKLVSRPEISFSPRTGSFVEGGTFEVPILINTKGKSVNGIEIRLDFDKNKLSIIKPSGGTSIIDVWVEPPKYDNSKGTASYVGVVPGGIVTASGLVGTITFKAINTGSASISISSASKILLNDGLGTEVSFDSIKAQYTIIPKAPEGLRIFSDTHPFQGEWYKNDNPVLSWESEVGVDGYSFTFDNKPDTLPDNIVDTTETSKSFENLNDGLWYFHIKANKNGAWGNTGHFLIRIDKTPPAEFKPEANYIVSAIAVVERTLVSFFTTDNLSGTDHYEVGIIDKSQPVTESPVFVESESPYQVPINSGSNLKVIIRALDKAGNTRDVSLDVKPPLLITKIVKDYLVYILAFIILAGLFGLITHYLFGHHIIRHIKRLSKMIKDEGGTENASNTNIVEVKREITPKL